MLKNKTLIKSILLIFIGIVAIIALAPILWMFLSSFKTPPEIFSYPLQILPETIRIENYVNLFEQTEFPRFFLNSAIVTPSYTIISLLFSAMCGFGFAKYEFKGRKVLFILVIAALMIPIYVILIPLYTLMARIGWLDTYRALILPFSAHPIGVLLMRQYIYTLPNQLLDSARIDGCNEWQIFWKIMIPLSKPALGACGVFLALFNWDNFVWPLVVLRSQRMFTIPLGLSLFMDRLMVDYGMVMAGSVFATAPILLFYFLAQKHFIAGLTSGAVKG